MELGSLRVGAEAPAKRSSGIPAKLRSLFANSARAKRPEPRVRFGQPFLPGLTALTRQHLAEARPFLERADAIRGRRFTYLGRTVGYPGRIEWDPQGLSERWRIALNSLDDLLPLGVAALMAPTPDVRRRWYEVAAALVREWITGAPTDHGVAWSFPALARRIPNLIHAHALFATELRKDVELRHALLDSLSLQGAALAEAVPRQPADHELIGAGRALFMAGRFFDGMEARGWLEVGAQLLWEQLKGQFHEDGGHASRNLAIHARALADYAEVLALLHAANDDAPIWARKRVKSMADFLARLLHPDGDIVLFQDAGLDTAPPAREVLAAIGVALHEPGLAPPGELPGVWPLLVVGDAGRRVHAHLPRRHERPEARALRRAGFYVLPGDSDDVMFVDAGSPAPDGDAGVFGFELSVGGQRLIVDAGTSGEEMAPWPEFFRSTRAHNVVMVGGAEQFAGTRPPAVSDVHWVVRDGLLYLTGTHDGFAHLTLDMRLHHRRRVFCLPGRFWLVCDEIIGSGEWGIESFLHFHPEVEVRATCSGGAPCFSAARSARSQLQVVAAGTPEVRLVQGAEDPPQGWYAARAGEREPAAVLSLRARGRLPLVFGYALLPRAEGPAKLEFEHDAFRLGATLKAGGQEFLLSVVQGDVEMTVR
jgi:hypothetical protein